MSILLILIIGTSHIFNSFHIPVSGLNENRILAQRPNAPNTIVDLLNYPSLVERYAQDRFQPRGFIISTLNYFRYLFGYSGNPRVIVGDKGWLFSDGDNHLGTARGTERLSPNEIQNWVTGFQQYQIYVTAHRAAFYMLIAPTKETVYQEYVPQWLHYHATSEIDDILRSLKEKGMDQLIDVRAELRAAKDQDWLYTPYDIHWSGRGAYIAYKALMKRISVDFPTMVPFSIHNFIEHDFEKPRDLSFMLGIADKVGRGYTRFQNRLPLDSKTITYLENSTDWTKPHIVHTGITNKPRVLLIRDSFSPMLIPFLEPHFSEMIIVHNSDGAFRPDMIQQYHPDIVILEVIESGVRYMMAPINAPQNRNYLVN